MPMADREAAKVVQIRASSHANGIWRLALAT